MTVVGARVGVGKSIGSVKGQRPLQKNGFSSEHSLEFHRLFGNHLIMK